MTRPDSARVFVPPPLLYLAGIVFGLAIDGRLKLEVPSGPLWQRLLAAVLIAAAVGLIVAGLRKFKTSGTAPEPWAPASALVTRGVYRWTRNPLYLGLTLLYGGLALLFRSPAAAAILVVIFGIMNFIVIGREEAYLKRRFGIDYETYRARVRRWM
jgi:protein-S-isoprenylcysteine O-methyltransferase Ste14